MAVDSNSLKLRKKAGLKTNLPQTNREEKKREIFGKSEFGAKLRCLVYIAACLALTSSLAWFILCYALHKELSICRTEFFASFISWKRNNSNDSKHISSKSSKIRAPVNDSLLWVIDRRSNLSLSEFIEKYDGKRPVLITDALKGWKANEWSRDFFQKNYGDQQVVMKAVHIYLKEDFFQILPKEVRPWNAMLLWGTPYSRSYLHIDPYNWTGTNAVFSGKKLWKLYPPGQDKFLYVMPNKKSEFPLNCYKYNSRVDAFNPDLKKYPKFSKARAISFEQKPGELLIIPPGWFHQAFNEIETIAVSSQVMNSQNYHIILEEIFKAGNIDRKILPSDFFKLPPIEQVMLVSNSLSSEIIQRGRDVTKEILQQLGYSAK